MLWHFLSPPLRQRPPAVAGSPGESESFRGKPTLRKKAALIYNSIGRAAVL